MSTVFIVLIILGFIGLMGSISFIGCYRALKSLLILLSYTDEKFNGV